MLILHAATATTGLFLAPPDAGPLLGPAVTWLVALPVLVFGLDPGSDSGSDQIPAKTSEGHR